MSFVQVTIIDPDGNAHKAEVDPSADPKSILADLVEDLKLSSVEDYKLRYNGKIRDGCILVIDKAKNRSARLL